MSRKGRRNSPEHNEAIRKAQLGRKKTPEELKKISEGLLRVGMKGEKHYKWNPDRDDQARKAAMTKLSRGFIGRVLSRKLGGYKSIDDVVPELGYTPRQFVEHISSQFNDGMDWTNYGRGLGKWNVDHIRPISSFPDGTPLSVTNELTNLRPLWAEENFKKGGKWNEGKASTCSRTDLE